MVVSQNHRHAQEDLVFNRLETAACQGTAGLSVMSAPGTVSKAEIESTYKITRRIEAEERSLEGATMVFTSTQQEIDEQWGLYDSCALDGSFCCPC